MNFWYVMKSSEMLRKGCEVFRRRRSRSCSQPHPLLFSAASPNFSNQGKVLHDITNNLLGLIHFYFLTKTFLKKILSLIFSDYWSRHDSENKTKHWPNMQISSNPFPSRKHSPPRSMIELASFRSKAERRAFVLSASFIQCFTSNRM